MNERPGYNPINRLEGVKPLELPFRLQTSPSVDALCDRIRTATPDWQMIAIDARRFPRKKDIGMLSEIHVGHVIERTANIDPFLQDKIIRDAVPHNAEKDNYIFNRVSDGRLYCYTKNVPKRAVAEYDHILLVDALPVVIEVKTTSYPNNSGLKKNTLNYALTEEAIIQRFEPLEKLFGQKRFSYIVVVNPEAIIPHSKYQQNFQRAGGIIIPFAPTHTELQEEVRKRG